MGNIERDLAAERIAALEWAVEYWRAEAEAAHRRTAKWQEKVGDARRELRGAVSAGVAEVVAWIRREYAEGSADATFSYYGLTLADDIERHFGGR